MFYQVKLKFLNTKNKVTCQIIKSKIFSAVWHIYVLSAQNDRNLNFWNRFLQNMA